MHPPHSHRLYGAQCRHLEQFENFASYLVAHGPPDFVERPAARPTVLGAEQPAESLRGRDGVFEQTRELLLKRVGPGQELVFF